MQLATKLQIPMSPDFYEHLGAKSARRGNAAKVGVELRGGEICTPIFLNIHEYIYLYMCRYVYIYTYIYVCLFVFLFTSYNDLSERYLSYDQKASNLAS